MDRSREIVMENTGHYHYPVSDKPYHSGFDVHVINPFLLKRYGETVLHKNKTDPKDTFLIARFILKKSNILQPYGETGQKYPTTKPLALTKNHYVFSFKSSSSFILSS